MYLVIVFTDHSESRSFTNLKGDQICQTRSLFILQPDAIFAIRLTLPVFADANN